MIVFDETFKIITMLHIRFLMFQVRKTIVNLHCLDGPLICYFLAIDTLIDKGLYMTRF